MKCDSFREYLADRYNERDSVSVPMNTGADQPPAGSEPPPPPRKGGDGAEATPERAGAPQARPVRMGRLTDRGDGPPHPRPGTDELARCITYVDEAAQTTCNKNKWKDWNLVIRKCSKGRWGLERTPAQRAARGKAHPRAPRRICVSSTSYSARG